MENNTEYVIGKLKELKKGGVCTYRDNLANDALALIEKLKAENAELRAKVEGAPELAQTGAAKVKCRRANETLWESWRGNIACID